MENWEKIFKDKLKDREIELPADDLSLFEEKLAAFRNTEHKEKSVLPWLLPSMAGMAALLLFFVMIPWSQSQEGNRYDYAELISAKYELEQQIPEAMSIVDYERRPCSIAETNTAIQAPITPEKAVEESDITKETEPGSRIEEESESKQISVIIPNAKKDNNTSNAYSFNFAKKGESIDDHNIEVKLKSKRRTRFITISSAALVTGIGTSLLASNKSVNSSATVADEKISGNALSSDDITSNIPKGVWDEEYDYTTIIIGEEPTKAKYPTTANSAFTIVPSYSHEPVMKHHFPLIVSIALRYPLTEKLSLNTALEYSYYSSTEQSTYVDHYFMDNGYVMDSFNQLSWNHSAHYLGVPLRLDYSFIKTDRFDVYAGAGPMIDWCIKKTVDGGDREEKDGCSISLFAAGGVQVNLNKSVGFFVEPRLSWLIPSGSQVLQTYRTEHRLNFNAAFGIRFTINK